MAAANPRTRGNERSCAVSDQSLQSMVRDSETILRLERELAAVTADLEFRRELGALQQQEYDKVTAERDALKAELDRVTTKCVAPALFQLEKIRTEQVMVAGLSGAANCISHARVALGDTWTEVDQNRDGYVDELHASQQEARRFRESLDAIMESAKVAYCATTEPMMTDALVGIGKRCKDAIEND